MTGPDSSTPEDRAGDSSRLGSGLVLFLAINVGNASNFLFHVAVSRKLGPSEYGALGAVLGLVLVFGVPAAALQVAITREVAAGRFRDGRPVPVVVGPLLANAVLWGILATLVLLPAAPLIQDFLHLPSLSTAVMLALFALPCAVGVVPRAVLIGQSRFRRVSAGILAGTATRLAVGVALVTPGRGVAVAMAATVLGEVVTAAVLVPAMRTSVEGPADVTPVRVRWRDASAAIAAFTGFFALAGIDTVLARHFLPAADSGLYAAAATGARAVLFLPLAVSLIHLPRFAESGADSPAAREALWRALLVVSLLSAGALVVVMAVPDLVVSTLFGGAFEDSTSALGLLSVASGCLGLANVLMHYHLAARRRVASSLSWAGVVAAVVLVSRAHGSIESVATVMLVVSASVAAAMLVPVLTRRSAPAPLGAGDGALWSEEPELDLTVVVPYFNPGTALCAHVENVVAVLRESGASFEVIAVSDGSDDGSDATLAGVAPDVLRHIVLTENAGKGQALRVGLGASRGRYVGFIDADGDVDAGVLGAFVALVELYQPDVVLGSKRHPMSRVEYPFLRRVYSAGYQLLVRVLFRLNIRDSQTGVKLVRRDVLAAALSRMVEKRFAFDLELFVVARHLGHRRFFEAPVTIRHQFTSTIRFASVRGMLVDTLAIFYRLRLLRYYDEPRNPVEPWRGKEIEAAQWNSSTW